MEVCDKFCVHGPIPENSFLIEFQFFTDLVAKRLILSCIHLMKQVLTKRPGFTAYHDALVQIGVLTQSCDQALVSSDEFKHHFYRLFLIVCDLFFPNEIFSDSCSFL